MKRAQAALEFLTTYGWAFLMIIIAIAALGYFGILDPRKTLSGRCNLGPEIECRDYSISESGVNLKLSNKAGWPIVVDSLTVSNQNGDLSCQSPLVNAVWVSDSIKDVPILCDAEFLQGENEKLDIKISYHKTGNSNLYSTEIKGEVLAIVQGNATRDIAGNLKGQWHFDEGAGGMASDSSGNGNDGAINGAGWVAGIKGNALSFDGINDRVEVADSPSLNPRSQITIIAWVNFHNTTGLTDQNIIINKENIPFEISVGDKGNFCFMSIAQCPYQYRHYLNWYIGNVAPSASAPEAEWGWKLGGGPISQDSWQHLALTYDGSSVRAYINANLVGNYNINPQGLIIQSTPDPLWIGARSNFAGGSIADGESVPAGNSNFKGMIDEVKIYNISLTNAEIFADYIS